MILWTDINQTWLRTIFVDPNLYRSHGWAQSSSIKERYAPVFEPTILMHDYLFQNSCDEVSGEGKRC